MNKIASTVICSTVITGLTFLSGCIPHKVEPIEKPSAVQLTAAMDVPAAESKPVMYQAPALPAPQADEAASQPVPAPAVSTPKPAPVVSYRQTQQRIHVVQRGQTLWRIARMYYGRANADLVAQIVAANSEISNPNLIYPGQEIIIP